MESDLSCFADFVCVRWDATFPFWEVLASLAVTAFVTVVTIRWSVRAARDETTRTLLAAARREARDRRERAAEAEAARAAEDANRRAVLASSMVRAVHLRQMSRKRGAESSERLTAKAEWAALRAPMEMSGLAMAAELYEATDLTMERADSPWNPKPRKLDLLGDTLKADFSVTLGQLISSWARAPEDARWEIDRRLVEVREWRDARDEQVRDVMRFMTGEQNLKPVPKELRG